MCGKAKNFVKPQVQYKYMSMEEALKAMKSSFHKC